MPYKIREAPARPTIVCPACHGTGLDRAHATRYLTSRAPHDDAARAATLRCSACDGAGRLTTEHALVLGLPVT
jgi:DnaJ-class molecular chaperone